MTLQGKSGGKQVRIFGCAGCARTPKYPYLYRTPGKRTGHCKLSSGPPKCVHIRHSNESCHTSSSHTTGYFLAKFKRSWGVCQAIAKPSCRPMAMGTPPIQGFPTTEQLTNQAKVGGLESSWVY
jgi:hypothetical protein